MENAPLIDALENLCFLYENLRHRHKYGATLLQHSKLVEDWAEPQIRRALPTSSYSSRSIEENGDIDKFKETLEDIGGKQVLLFYEVQKLKASPRSSKVVQCMKELQSLVKRGLNSAISQQRACSTNNRVQRPNNGGRGAGFASMGSASATDRYEHGATSGLENSTSTWRCSSCLGRSFENYQDYEQHMTECRMQLSQQQTAKSTEPTEPSGRSDDVDDGIVELPLQSDGDALMEDKESCRQRQLATTQFASKRKFPSGSESTTPIFDDREAQKDPASPIQAVPPKKKKKTVARKTTVSAHPSRERLRMIASVAPPVSFTNGLNNVGTTKMSFSFTLHESVQEVARQKNMVYDLEWSKLCVGKTQANEQPWPRSARYLATCGGRYVHIYGLEQAMHPFQSSPTNQPVDYKDMQLVRCYKDFDCEEEFYACAFAGRTQLSPYIPKVKTFVMDKRVKIEDTSSKAAEDDDLPDEWQSILRSYPTAGLQLLCAAGKKGLIHVIDTIRDRVICTLMGHGHGIHDLKVSPTDEWLLLSASADESCRLWNLRTKSTVAVFGGHAGHRDAVNAVSWHANGHQFASGGNDSTIKVWEFSTTVQEAIETSHLIADELEHGGQIDEGHCAKLAVEQFPLFSSRKLHVHYVDCVQFIGDLIVSKAAEVESTDNYLRLWCPKIERKTLVSGLPGQPPPSDITLLRTFNIPDANNWITRFAIDPSMRLLAAGNDHGKVHVWDIASRTVKPIGILQTKRSRNPVTYAIRCVNFSPDGSMLMVSADDGSVYRWNVTQKP